MEHHVLGHKTNLIKFKNIMPCIIFDQNAMKLEVNHKKKCGKTVITWRLSNILLSNEWANQGIKEKNLERAQIYKG